MLITHKITFPHTEVGDEAFGEAIKYLYDSTVSFRANYEAQGCSTLEFECDDDTLQYLKHLMRKNMW